MTPRTISCGGWTTTLIGAALAVITACDTGVPTETPASTGSIDLVLHDPTGRPSPVDRCEVALCTRLLALIEDAESSIDFAVYGFRNQTQITNALLAAQARGVEVRGVVDRDTAGKNYYSSTDDFIAQLGDVRDDLAVDRAMAEENAERPPPRAPRCERPEGFEGPLQCLAYDLGDQCLFAAHASRGGFVDAGAIMHHKFFVVDRRHVWTGSTNVSDSGTGGYNANMVAIIDSPIVAGWYTREFEQMYRGGRFHGTKQRSPEQRTTVGDAEIEVLFSPQDRAITNAVRPLLRKAERRIDIAVFFLTNKWITGDLLAAKRRGVEVRVILDATAATNGYTKHELLRAAGIPVKIERFGGKMHMKSAAIDGETVITGSMNWTSAGESSNDENTIIVHSPALAARYHEFYDSLWQSIDESALEGRPDPESNLSGTSCTDGVDNDFDDLADGEDPGCGDDPPPLPALPPHVLEPKGERSTCEYR